MRRFDDKSVLVTGAASGIGRACALRFAREGAQVGLLDWDAAGNRETAELCAEQGAEPIELDCDVRDAGGLERAFEELLDAFGRLDVLVTCAGVYAGQPLEAVPDASWNEVLEINLGGVFRCNRLAAAPMKEQAAGSIVNVSSMAGKTSFPATAQYSASKSGVIGLTRSVALELAPFGVTANVICPGNTETPMLHEVARAVAPGLGMSPPEWLAMRAADCPLGRFAEPEEIAGVAAFLASEDARYLTGQALAVDGGMVLC